MTRVSKRVLFNGTVATRPGTWANQYLQQPFPPEETLPSKPEMEARLRACVDGVHACSVATLPHGEIHVRIALREPENWLKTQQEKSDFGAWCDNTERTLQLEVDKMKPLGCVVSMVVHRPETRSLGDAYVGHYRHLSQQQLELLAQTEAATAWAKAAADYAKQLDGVTKDLKEVIEFVEDFSDDPVCAVIADALKQRMQPSKAPSNLGPDINTETIHLARGMLKAAVSISGNVTITHASKYNTSNMHVERGDVDVLRRLLKQCIDTGRMR